jgi:hypothetical protein
MAGILLYTAPPDSEGTLGGLVELGVPQTLGLQQQALESMRICASDPLCSEHRPDGHGRDIQGACGHACPLGPTVCKTARPRQRLFRLVFESHTGRALVPIPKRSTSPRATSTPYSG